MFFIKGSLLGAVLFIVFLVVLFRSWSHKLGLPGGSFSVQPVALFGNPIFWSALFFCLAVGMAVVGYWPKTQ